MKKVSGGVVVADEDEKIWYIVRQDGTVIGPAPSEDKAIEFAKTMNVSTELLTKEEYKTRFGRELVW